MGAIAKTAAQRSVSPAQSTAIKFVDDHGDEITITSEDVRMHICPAADAKEVAYFMELCRAQRLNPFLNEAYLVKFQGKPAQIMVAHKALVKRAEAHPQYDGMQHGVIVMTKGGEVEKREGCAYPGEQLIGGWCKVYRKDRRMPIYSERSFTSMNKGQANWKSMPDVMIDKCAQAAALREAFPDELRAMYTTDEMGVTKPQEIKPDEVSAPPVSATRIDYKKPSTMPKEDLAYLKESTVQLVALGYDESEVKSYLWDTYKGVGINAVRAWVESKTDSQAEIQADVAPVGVDPNTGEIGPDFDPAAPEIELADEDIPFPGEQ